LCRGAYKNRIKRKLAKTQSHAQFFITQFGKVMRQVCREIAFIMTGPPADRAFEQPFTNPIFPATAHLTEFSQQGRYMNGVAEPSRERWTA
jgi:hypothetical protein